jgi:nucleoside-diphosphate-sugar epimerase
MYGKNAKDSSLFPSLVRSILQEKEITLVGENGLIFNPISSRQAALALIHLISCDAAGVYNLSGHESTNLKSVVGKISSRLNKKPIFKVLSGSSQLLGDSEKLKASGFSYSESLEEGLSNYMSEIELP